MTRDDELARIAAVVRRGSRRTPLYRWLRARHDAVADLLAENRPHWRVLAEGFAELGLTASGGRPLSGEVVRRTWWAVRRDVAAARARRATSPPEPAVAPARQRPAARDPVPPAPAAAAVSPARGGMEALARLRADIDERSGRKRHG